MGGSYCNRIFCNRVTKHLLDNAHSYCMQNKSFVLSLLEKELMRKISEEYFIPPCQKTIGAAVSTSTIPSLAQHMGAEPQNSFEGVPRGPLYGKLTTRHHRLRDYMSPN